MQGARYCPTSLSEAAEAQSESGTEAPQTCRCGCPRCCRRCCRQHPCWLLAGRLRSCHGNRHRLRQAPARGAALHMRCRGRLPPWRWALSYRQTHQLRRVAGVVAAGAGCPGWNPRRPIPACSNMLTEQPSHRRPVVLRRLDARQPHAHSIGSQHATVATCLSGAYVGGYISSLRLRPLRCQARQTCQF